MELEDKVTRLENDLAIIKPTIKDVLVELKELMLQDHNPPASLDPTQVSHVYARAVGNFFLGQSAFEAERANVSAEGRDIGVHGEPGR